MPNSDKPISGTAMVASRICSSTDSGNAPGPPEKLRLLREFIFFSLVLF
jgi:hypothetical protein